MVRMKDNLSLVIPCYNEPDNIPLLIAELKILVSSLPFSLEVIIVDGASNDGTQKILQDEFQNLDQKHFKLILQKNKNGYGFDIIEGLKIASHKTLAWTHADMQTDINDVIRGFQLYKSYASNSKDMNFILKGNRSGRSYLDTIFTSGMQIFVLGLLRVSLNDINAQPKIFSQNFFKNHLESSGPNDFSLDLFILFQAKRLNYEIISFPVIFKNRLFGSAKGGGGSFKNKLRLIKRTFKYILKLRRDSLSTKFL